MTERLLQFIWQLQYFNKNELTTVSGEPIQVLSAGQFNRDQGPDFSDAKIRIGQTTWAGAAELHLRSSDWKKHKHQEDKNYNNVILHVVWQDDGYNNDIPVLELENRIPAILLQRYEALMHTGSFIPCENMIRNVNELNWISWKDRLLAERLQRKAAYVESMLNDSKQHWEETFWRMLAGNFGMKVNTAAFEAMARSIPLKLLARHQSQLQQLEALLLGQAGLLNQKIIGDEYYNMLQKEYRFLAGKYQLQQIHMPVHFLRMRPGNFPTIRLAQLAVLVQNSVHLFPKILEISDIADIKDMLDITANDYWHYHYRFGETSSFKKKHLGTSMTDIIIINTVIPVLFAYGNFHMDNRYKEKALKWLGQLSSESNTITRGFGELLIENNNAFDSQALIELKNEYCDKKRCLECGIGNAILKN